MAGAICIFACAQIAHDAQSEDSPGTATPASNAAPPRKLDLRVPDITEIFTPQELDRILADTIDPDIEEVEVEGERTPPPPSTPVVWPGIFAPFWAVTHPTQAWRILAPLPPDQANSIGSQPPDATDPYKPPPPLPGW